MQRIQSKFVYITFIHCIHTQNGLYTLSTYINLKTMYKITAIKIKLCVYRAW